MRSLFSLLLASVAALAHAELPARVEIAYAMTRNGSSMAEVTERFERAGSGYTLTETWRGRGVYALLGNAKRVSQGSVGAEGLRPREFTDERSGRDTARAWFDWQAGILTMQYKGERRSEPLPPNAQDRLSFVLALSFLPGKSEAATYSIVDGRGVSRREYRITGRERLKLPAGEFDTVVVARQGGDPKESALVWLAAQRNHVPVKLLVVEKDGTRYEQLATRISTP